MKPTELASCVITDEYGRVLLLHRVVDEIGHWELPGGLVDEDQAPAEAAAQALLTQLDVRVSVRAELGKEAFEQAGDDYLSHWFAADIVQGTPVITDSDNFDDADYFEFEDIPALALSVDLQILFEKIQNGDIVLDPGDGTYF
ncbi:MAG: hypothetical protein JWN38_583 [Candidatus Saccharibacteria bacterium]|nr:hypothetical protein [Candidatus Saccharibacteria bacterium]